MHTQNSITPTKQYVAISNHTNFGKRNKFIICFATISAQSIDSCYTDEGGKIYCYKNPNKFTSWDNANQICQGYGGHLPAVLLAGKQNYLKT